MDKILLLAYGLQSRLPPVESRTKKNNLIKLLQFPESEI